MMKKLALFFAFACILLSMKANATQIAAGSIRIESFNFTNDHDLFADIYTSCTGDPPPSSLTLCFEDILTPGNSFTATLYPDFPTGTTVPIGWGDSTQCDDPSSTIPGYKRWAYYGTVTFPGRSIWRYSLYLDTLEATDNIISQPFYIDNILDEVTSFGGPGSSIYIPQNKVYYVPAFVPASIDLDAYNLSADSFVFEIDTILTSTGACIAPTAAPFQAATPAYSIPDNPFQTDNSFILSQSILPWGDGTATLNFTPTQAGSYLLGVKTKSYRITGNGGVWIPLDISRHWFRIIVLNVPCDTFSGGNIGCFTNCTASADTVTGMYNQPMSFCYNLQAGDTGVHYIVNDNHATSIPGATVTYTGQDSDTVTGTFNWTPNTLADTGIHMLIFDVVDTACIAHRHYSDTVYVYIPAPLCDTFDGGTLGCFDNCVALGNNVIGLYNWPISFCYNAQSADTNVRYLVTDDHASSLPGATITYTGQYSDTVVGTFDWTASTLADTGWHTIMFDVIDTSCSTPVHYTDTVNIYIPGFLNVNTPEQQQLKLFPNPNSGHFMLSSDVELSGKIEVLNMIGQVVYITTYTRNINLPAELPNGRYLLKAYKGNTPLTIPFILSR